MQQINKYLYLNYLFFLFIFLNLFSGWGFQILNFSNLPVTYVFLLIFLINSPIIYILKKIEKMKLFTILIVFFFYNIILLVFSFYENGIYAFRDATYIIDVLFIFFGFSFFLNNDKPINNLLAYFKILLPLSLIFILIFLLRNSFSFSSFIVNSPTGRSSDFFFNFSTLQYMWIFFGLFSLLFFENKKFGNLIFILLVTSSIILFPKRINYLWVLIILTILNIYYRELFVKSFKFIFYLIIFIFLLEIIIQNNYLNISNKFKFIYFHVLSSFPGFESNNDFFTTTSGTAKWRIYYFNKIINDAFSNHLNLVFGKGFGIPLTDFNVQGVFVRDPHNMYLSVFARTGLFGLIIFLIMHLKFLKIFIQNLKICSNNSFLNKKKILILFFVFYIYYLIPAGLTSAVLSSTFISTLIYIFIGFNLAINLKLLNENNTNSQ